MSVTKVANRYAKSLLDLAIEQDKLERVREDVETFREVTKNRDFKLFLKNPMIQQVKKSEIVHKLFKDKYDELTMAFLVILIKKGREVLLPEIADQFIELYKKIKHISTVKLTTAVEISPEAIEKIRKKLAESAMIERNIEIVTQVNPELIGGFILEFEDWVYDAGIAHKLELFRRELFSENLYISQIIAR